jgi:DNA-binding transcriptional LysR family regulator
MMNCHEELASGELIQLLPEWSLPGGNLQAAYTQRRGMLPAVRAWIEHVSVSFTADTGCV